MILLLHIFYYSFFSKQVFVIQKLDIFSNFRFSNFHGQKLETLFSESCLRRGADFIRKSSTKLE